MGNQDRHRVRASRRRASALALGSVAAVIGTTTLVGAGGGGLAPLPTTSDDFTQGGTQPQPGNPDFAAPTVSTQCSVCHANYDLEVEPFRPWASSMLAQSARDPIFWAGVSIANQDAHGAGEFCIRCHAPNAFLNGRAPDADNHNFTPADEEGVNCVFCHRVVDPVFDEETSPSQDEQILAELAAAGVLPVEGSNARYVIDPVDNRRGPFATDDFPFNPHPGGAETIESGFHTESEFCWTCHDVSNPLMESDGKGNYTLGALGASHGTGSQKGQFPLHRTYSEWKNSYYSSIGVQHDGRFGGNHPTGLMKSCQDCHMPDMEGHGCSLPGWPSRPDVPQHSFLGSNSWVLRAVNELFPESETGLSPDLVEAGIARNQAMLAAASDLTLNQRGNEVDTRLINRSGHKLPTGFPDGRRVWFNLVFRNAAGDVVAERGAYDHATGDLVLGGADTTVIEAHFAISEDLAAELGRAPGKTFNFVLANEIEKDNRIPPAGWSNAIAIEEQMQPVGETYANGQHWMDRSWQIPVTATSVTVTTYHQTTSREFAEFLRDENYTDDRGQTAYDLWVQFGRSAPVVMDMVEMDLVAPGDLDGDGAINFTDLVELLSRWGLCPGDPQPCPGDIDGDGSVGFPDLIELLGALTI